MQNISVAQLNGIWQMQPEKTTLDRPKGSTWCTVEIPMPWSAFSLKTGVPEDLIPHRKAWFRKSFSVPEVPHNSRLMLHFDAVNFFTTVIVNGKVCGQNTGDCIPFDIDITNAVRGQQAALLLVGVQDISAAEQTKGSIGLRKLMYPGLGTHPGIWGDVYLWLKPAVHITDITISTTLPEQGSVSREGHVRIKVQIKNEMPEAANFSLTSEIYDGARQVLPFAPISGSIGGGQKSDLDFGTSWESASFWWPDQPHLYTLRASIWTEHGAEQGDIAHKASIPIGFRDFKAQGRHFTLNNVPVKIRSEAVCPVSGKLFGESQNALPVPPHRDNVTKMFEMYKKLYNINTLRFHRLPPTPVLLNACDQMGLMAIVELPFPDDETRYAVDNPEFWTHAQDFARKWITARLQHPSIIMWSVGQGMIQRYGSRVIENFVNFAKFIQEIDPSRPVELSGDILNPRQGELPSCSLSTFFPDTGVTFRSIEPHRPAYLKDRILPRPIRTTITIPDPPEKPTAILEHTRKALKPDSMAFFLGDAAYSPSLTSDKLAELSNIEMGACRIAGIDSVGMIGRRIKADPHDDVAREVAAVPKELFGNTYAGVTLQENLLVCNDTRLDQDFTLVSKLITDDGAVAEHTEEIMLPAGAAEPKSILFDIPAVNEIHDCNKPALGRQAELHIELAGSRTGSFKSKKDITIWPHVRAVGGRKVHLIDPAGLTGAALVSVGVNFETVTSFKPGGCDTVIIGENATSHDFADAPAIRDFVNRGGLAIYLAQQAIPHDLAPVTLVLDQHGASSITFIRDAEHPLFDGISNANMRWWRDSHILASQCFRKPSRGNFRCLLDAGGPRGLGWTGIIEVFHGRGSFIFVQTELVERAKREPVAALLLARLADAKPAWSPAKVKILAGGPFPGIGVMAPEITDDFIADDIKDAQTILIAGPELSCLMPQQMQALSAWMKAGGSLYLHGLKPDQQGLLDSLCETKLTLVELPQERFVLRSPGAGLLRGISSADLSIADHASRSIGAVPTKYTAADTVIHTDAVIDDAAMTLRAANIYGMLSLGVGNGRLVIDQIRWDAEGFVDARSTRYTSTLLTNLGVPLAALDCVEPSSQCVMVDITAACNTTMIDDIPDDGAGWTGRGPDNDLRRLSPGTMVASCVPFDIMPADKPGALNCCVIGPDDELLAQPIKIGFPAREFAFLLACEGHMPQGTPIAHITIQYDDGLEARIPLRFGLDVHDWNERARKLEGADFAWKGTTALGEPAVLYVKKWQAARPTVPVKSIVFSSTSSGVIPALIAVTALK